MGIGRPPCVRQAPAEPPCEHDRMADHKMTKSIGEHWACSELARRGWAPALTRDGLARTDILAVGTHLPGRPQIEVQVKSATELKNAQATSWFLGTTGTPKALAHSDREWFILTVIPADPVQPVSGFVVPRDHVVAGTFIAHESWRTDPEATPGTRNKGMDGARVNVAVFAEYRNRWDLLAHPAGKCPVLLPEPFQALAQGTRVGLPEGHPWRDEMPPWGG